MSYGIMPYAVDLAGVRSALGSRDEALVAGLRDRYPRMLDGIDELGDADGPTARTVLEQMIMGEEYDEQVGYAYGYCLEILCEDFGRILTNQHWSGMRYAWFDVVEEALQEAGVKFYPSSLTMTGAGVPLPWMEFPAIGHLTRAEMPDLLRSLEAMPDAHIPDGEVLAAVREIEGWLRHCVRSGRDLVCFYH